MINIATVFSGIGSFEWALKRLGIEYNIVFACDNGEVEIEVEEDIVRNEIKKLETLDEQKLYLENLYKKSKKTNFVKKSYLANYDIEEKDFLRDIRFIDGSKYRDKIDIFVGGSPCQSFSIMGMQKGFEDTRGTLFYDYARLISEIKPKVFVYENVQRIQTHDKGRTWLRIEKTFNSLGYKIYYKVLDAQNYGIPQIRRRMFVVGFREYIDNFKFPLEKKLKYTMQDFLESNVKYGNFKSIDGNITLIREPGEIDEKYFPSEKVLKHVMSGGTKSYYIRPEIDLPIARTLLSTMHKMHRAGVDNYVTTEGRIRKLTPRECLRLMGFCDSFKIVVSDTQAYQQAGNSIVVDVLIGIMREIIKAYPEIIQEGKSKHLREIAITE